MWRNEARTIYGLFLSLLLFGSAFSAPTSSTPREALDLLLKTNLPDSSIYWPHIKRTLFIDNLKANILAPLAMYQGSNTNFCGYAALSYIPLHDDRGDPAFPGLYLALAQTVQLAVRQ
jgi:hypothetical protein